MLTVDPAGPLPKGVAEGLGTVQPVLVCVAVGVLEAIDVAVDVAVPVWVEVDVTLGVVLVEDAVGGLVGVPVRVGVLVATAPITTKGALAFRPSRTP